jgi:FKBP-type peptidyl-prolyl cis-trans isomerase FkpA
MKHSYLTLFLLLTLGLFSCRKDENDIDIKTYDQQQIDAYIKANGLTNMKRDMTNGDTTGIYYEILGQGTGDANLLKYETPISLVYSLKSLSGKYISSDTILNHSYNFVGRLTPPGLMMAVYNLAKYKGTRARFLIPSRLAYGRTGSGTGSTRLVGNESLDYYVNIINNQEQYDDFVIQKYIAANNLTGYTRSNTGLWYKVITPGTGTVPIVPTSTVNVTYTGRLINSTHLNGNIFDQYTDAAGLAFAVDAVIPGWTEALQKVTQGATLSLIIPSKLGYGVNSQSNQSNVVTIPANSILQFEMSVVTVTN